VYEGQQKIECGACGSAFFEFYTEPEKILLDLDDGPSE